MKFEWDKDKSQANKSKHGIDFNAAKKMWNDINRIEIQSPYPLEERHALISKIGKKYYTAIFTYRGNAIRIISVRRSREKEVQLYDEKGIR